MLAMMKKRGCLALALITLMMCLTGCGGQAVSTSRTAGFSGGTTVAEIMRNAENVYDSGESAYDVAETVYDYWEYPDDLPENAYDSAADAFAWDDSPDTDDSFNSADFSHDGIDIDLTMMSSTMVFGQVSGMMYMPEDYVGKTVRVQGQSYTSYYDLTDTTYYSILIADATACCAQGLEYTLANGAYPPDETEAVVTGVFELYDELGVTYCRLADAVLSA